MAYSYIKALHIIFIVTWFAGLFYLVRLFIYHVEAEHKDRPEKEILQAQFLIMERRLWYGITCPSAIVTFFCGSGLLHYYLPLGEHPWLMAKLFFVVLLYLYHFKCGEIFKSLKKGVIRYNSTQLRLFNEVPTIFLFSIVFLVVLKDVLNSTYAVVGLVALSAVLFSAVFFYKRLRRPSE